jgi:hypothetical protein
MPFDSRAKRYAEIQRLRDRPLIAYVTSLRQNATGQMASDAIAEFARHIRRVPSKASSVDVLIVSNGGDPTVSWRVMSMLRARFSRVGVLLPYTAYSAATLLALGADEIVMHPFSNLGPVDPQLTAQRAVPGRPDQREAVQFGSEDLRNFLQFVKEDVGISDQEQLQRSFDSLMADVGAVPIGVAKRSSQLALSLGEKLLLLHMQDKTKVRAIAESLNTSFYHHGYPVGRVEAQEIGLPVVEPDDALAELIWEVWEDFESDMKCDRPYAPIVEVMASEQVRDVLTAPAVQVNLPSNLPPEVLQQAYQRILQQIPLVQVPPVTSEIFNAAIETVSSSSHFRTVNLIHAVRRPDLSIGMNVVQAGFGWRFDAAMVGGEQGGADDGQPVQD